MPLQVDAGLIEQARARLARHPETHWIIGGACTGKSTVSRVLAAAAGLDVCDMDTRIFGRFTFDPERHPATTAWFSAENPLAWVLSLTWRDFDSLNRATNAEFLDLLARELDAVDRPQPLLVDGGFTHPSVLAQAVDPTRIVCLETSPAEAVRCWQTAEDRAQMREWIQLLPEREAMWARFLDYGERMAQTMVNESHELGIPVIRREPGLSVGDLVQSVGDALGLFKEERGPGADFSALVGEPVDGEPNQP
jgi:hypothetical protein